MVSLDKLVDFGFVDVHFCMTKSAGQRVATTSFVKGHSPHLGFCVMHLAPAYI